MLRRLSIKMMSFRGMHYIVPVTKGYLLVDQFGCVVYYYYLITTVLLGESTFKNQSSLAFYISLTK